MRCHDEHLAFEKSGDLVKMKCGQRGMTLLSLFVGLLAVGSLALAVCTDYWLYTFEPFNQDLLPPGEESPDDNVSPNYQDATSISVMDSQYPVIDIETIDVHSGLWRLCTVIEGASVDCATISYSSSWERIPGVDTTFSILRAMRKAAPVFVLSLFFMIIAFTLATLGNAKGDYKTIQGAVLYIFSALTLAVGVILYISAVNDEVSHRKKPSGTDALQFKYIYGWAFFSAGGAFILSMMAAVSNISAYLKRYPRLEDMVVIIPGLHSSNKSTYDFSKMSFDDDNCGTLGSQNTTIIL